MAKAVIWLLIQFLYIGSISPQILEVKYTNSSGICKGNRLFKTVADLKNLEGCVVIVGSLEIFIEISQEESFTNMTFWDLREITEYLLIYRVNGLESVGKLFPNLARIRGLRLLNNFALIVYDNPKLTEIGLFSLIKIDRGGVTMWALPQACFVDTIDWKVLAPRARHVISPPLIDIPMRQIQCSVPCSCSSNAATNRCWNNRRCQIFLDGPEADKCNDQCLGCRKTNKDACFVCRHFTYKGKCLPECPPHTILLPDNQYCISIEECFELDRWVFNNTCVSECPMDYKIRNGNRKRPTTCVPCTHCEITCGSLKIQSLSSIQSAEKCVYVKGFLYIHVRAIPGVLGDLRMYLGHIQEVSEYISIEGSDITTLDFLSSLRKIKGQRLKDDKYSLNFYRNSNLQTLFSASVTKNLTIEAGTARFDHNPVLCMSKIDELKTRLPVEPNPLDIPEGSNGDQGACAEVIFDFEITLTGKSTALLQFSPIFDDNSTHCVLYVRLPPGVNTTVVPETCSEFEWHSLDIPIISDNKYGVVELNGLHAASSYALCIELYNAEKGRLVRSNIFNFTTPVGIPEPPFIVELVASASDVVVLRWVDHKDYVIHIDYYELDVTLIDNYSRTSKVVDYCRYKEDLFDADYTRHALVRRPPPEYARGCESMCGILSSVTPGAMVEEYFDVCDDSNFDCNNQESIISSNSSFGNYVRTLVLLNISSPRNDFQVGGLAPFSDYKFRLRACSGGQCSRSARGVVRTFSLKNADIPSITYLHANQFGHIFVRWNPPNVTNGPILSYSVEVLPRININDLMPQVWCVAAEETRIFVQSVIVSKYLVRVCVKTLASSNSCSDWIKITSVTESKTILLWIGVTCGILIYIASFIVGWLKKRLRHRSEVVPLVDSSSSLRVESEPPAMMLSDFVPFHTIPLD